MFKFISIRKPGPTDLTWDEKNSADYLYRPTDLTILTALERFPTQPEGSRKEKQPQKNKRMPKKNK